MTAARPGRGGANARLRITDEIFEAFPDVLVGIVVARGIDNSGEPAGLHEELRAAEAKAVEALGGAPAPEHPRIAPWRQAYKRFGADPRRQPSSVESLVRRVLKGDRIPRVSPLVDIYNAASLSFLLPLGGEDLDRIAGDLLLTTAKEGEASVLLLGEREERPPRRGEVIYRDDVGAVCRRWNWREADRTKLTAETANAVIVAEGLPPVGRGLIEEAIALVAERTRRYCGGEMATAVLDRGHRAAPLG